jgi:hypothetical protein
MTDIEHLRSMVDGLSKKLVEIDGDEEALVDGLRKIDIDLSNTLSEFVATTGKEAREFYPWRKRAKWARYHKQRAIEKKKEERLQVHSMLTDTQMLLYAQESGYRGESNEMLLRAAYHLLMEILSHSQYRMDPHQLGLVAAIRDRTEHIGTTPVL